MSAYVFSVLQYVVLVGFYEEDCAPQRELEKEGVF